MNEDELAAFNEIMGEIEGKQENQSNGTPKNTGPGDKTEPASSEQEPAALGEDIDAAGGENQTGADIRESTATADVDSGDSTDDSLDEDQQRAFESIMAQIESGGLGNANLEEEAGDASESAPADASTAELEKVVIEVDAGADAGPADPQPDESAHDEGLDPNQQQAFESIMAQIEGGGLADADSEQDSGDAPESENVDGISAELEKVAPETASAIGDNDQGAESAEPDDALTGGQQHAFESIMAQIEGDDTPKEEPLPTTAKPADPESSGTSEDREPHSAEPTKDATADESEDISTDIEDILTEIAASDGESRLPEAASNGSDTDPAAVGVSDQRMGIDGIVAHGTADAGIEHADHAETVTPAGQHGKTAHPDEPLQTKGPSGGRRSTANPMPAPLKGPHQPAPLHEPLNAALGRQKKTILASGVAILFLALVVFFYGIPQHLTASKPPAPDADDRPQDAAVEALPALQSQQATAAVQSPSGQSRLRTAAENLDRLRNELIDKQAEIGELRAYYQAGINAEIQVIADRFQNAGKTGMSLQSALADPGIGLGLSAIQRRDTYIKKLETPLNILEKSSEELLFLSRKASLLGLMAGKTSDLDIDGFIKQSDEIRNLHRSQLAGLNIDSVSVSAQTLASIWQDIEKRLLASPATTDRENGSTHPDNTTIWKNICDGDFSQKHMMTALSPDAARCLSAWEGNDLFLNALTSLSPEAARHLTAWQGDWLGLNGLGELSPEAAVHLARWKGKGLSLNGLSRLSPRVVAILSDWQGEQIELINVKHMAHWENPKTRLFLSEDLKRKRNTARK